MASITSNSGPCSSQQRVSRHRATSQSATNATRLLSASLPLCPHNSSSLDHTANRVWAVLEAAQWGNLTAGCQTSREVASQLYAVRRPFVNAECRYPTLVFLGAANRALMPKSVVELLYFQTRSIGYSSLCTSSTTRSTKVLSALKESVDEALRNKVRAIES
ncbi:uncharacterized protein RAG0_04697 [Rhynchosporium agropyri]|uniref:Uncharacterized protein n=1 Tax=Rhynchosporium agropyri TaxID=914238 RepID=A0A1E1KA39_9HELO|nr:uncharacterized protein RAG0_04697 [Rhynchosporium agropyri]